MKYKTVLITGKTGTVGSNLDFGFGFSSRLVDLRNKIQTEDLFARYKPEAVVHCAAKVGGLKLHLEQKYKLFYDNVMINTNVIEAAKNHGVQRVLSYLSSCIYSYSSPSPYTEKMIHDGEPFDVHYPYGYAKRMLEVQSRICYQEFGLKYNCVIPTNIYGFHDNFNSETGHVVAVLIHRAFEAAKTGDDFIVWGDGKQKRDFIFSEDIAKLTQWALENYFENAPLIFSNNTPVEIGEVANLIAKRFNIENKIVFDTSKPSGQKIRSLSGDKLASLTNFKFTSIEEGINKSVDWFVDNYSLDPSMVRL
jgi:GDP-L-fucose synthase